MLVYAKIESKSIQVREWKSKRWQMDENILPKDYSVAGYNEGKNEWQLRNRRRPLHCHFFNKISLFCSTRYKALDKTLFSFFKPKTCWFYLSTQIIKQEAHGPRVAHLSDIATADMQMLCNIFPIFATNEKIILILKNIIYGMLVNGVWSFEQTLNHISTIGSMWNLVAIA